MGLTQLVTPFPWSLYSKKLATKITNPRCVGAMSREDASARSMFFAEGIEGTVSEGNALHLYWLVDPDDGIIVDAKFQLFGQSALIGAAEAACELLIGKNYDQAKRVGADLIDMHVRDRSDTPAFPKETYPHLNLVVEAIEKAAAQCSHIPLATNYVAPPTPQEFDDHLGGGYPGWLELSKEKKISVIEQILDSEIRPYIALDAGGVDFLDLKDNKEVHIAYKGSCTSCMSSVGATLSFIQKVLRSKVHADLVVIPQL